MKKLRNDIILISVIVIAFIALFLVFKFTSKTDNVTAYIYHDNELIKEVALDVDQEFEITGAASVIKIEIKDKKIRILESGCRDQVCVHQGFIDGTNQTITCLPNHIMIKVVSLEGDDIII